MPSTILATKLFIPPQRTDVVERPRLNEQLAQGNQRKLTLISAPAGYGKTTLAAEWVRRLQQEERQRIAWLTLDSGDGNPIRFLHYFVAALQTISVELGESLLEALQAPQPPSNETILTSLVNEIASFPDELTIVLDDYHALESADVDRLLVFLLEHLPPNLHLLITTREDPALPLARLRARRQLTELRASDLRFTFAEAAEFLGQMMNVDISPEEVALLETRTEGWIAGLQLAALSMQGRGDVHEFVRAFAGDNRYIMDYLMEEVLEQQPSRIRDFLLQTSILERLSGPLCDAVLVDAGESSQYADGDSPGDDAVSQDILEFLEAANLFVDPLDDSRTWFRYHQLFASVLQAHLSIERPELTAELHRRASDWYEHDGQRASAIRHALAADDYERTAGLLELVWPEMDGTFQTPVWLTWARRLPAEIVRNRPVLSAGFAWAYLSSGMMEDGEKWLRRTEQLLAGAANDGERPAVQQDSLIVVDAEQMRSLPASLATARAYLAQAKSDLTGAVQNGRKALELLSPDDHILRGPPAALISMAYWEQGDLEAAAQALTDAMKEFEMAGHLAFASSGAFSLADMRVTQGRLREAVHVYERSLQLVQEGTRTRVRGTSYLYVGWSGLEIERNDIAEAKRLLAKGEEARDEPPLVNWQHRFHLTRAQLLEAQGDMDGALEQLYAAERAYTATPVPDVHPVSAHIARLHITQNRLQDAQEWAHRQALHPQDDVAYVREYEYITLARLLIAQHRQDQDEDVLRCALDLLSRLLASAESGGRFGSAMEILVLQALAYDAQNSAEKAMDALERALSLAESQGYVRVFLSEGAAIGRLLELARTQGIAPEYVDWLQSQERGGSDSPAEVESATNGTGDSAARTPSPQPLVEPLSPRELEILVLVAQGYSNREISEKLYLSISTVKGHNRNIFGKLHVQRRTGAVARARELNLL